MAVVLPKPKSITDDEVVLARTDWERLVSALEDREFDEDADDIAAVAAARSADAAMLARYKRNRDLPEATIPLEVVKAELDGVHPIRAWREYRGWTLLYLSVKSRVGQEFIDHMETRRKTGSVATLNRIARALNVPIGALLEEGVVVPSVSNRKAK